MSCYSKWYRIHNSDQSNFRILEDCQTEITQIYREDNTTLENWLHFAHTQGLIEPDFIKNVISAVEPLQNFGAALLEGVKQSNSPIAEPISALEIDIKKLLAIYEVILPEVEASNLRNRDPEKFDKKILQAESLQPQLNEYRAKLTNYEDLLKVKLALSQILDDLKYWQSEMDGPRKEMYQRQMVSLLNSSRSTIGFAEFGKILAYFDLAIPGLALGPELFKDLSRQNGQPPEKCLELIRKFLQHNTQHLKTAITNIQNSLENNDRALSRLLLEMQISAGVTVISANGDDEVSARPSMKQKIVTTFTRNVDNRPVLPEGYDQGSANGAGAGAGSAGAPTAQEINPESSDESPSVTDDETSNTDTQTAIAPINQDEQPITTVIGNYTIDVEKLRSASEIVFTAKEKRDLKNRNPQNFELAEKITHSRRLRPKLDEYCDKLTNYEELLKTKLALEQTLKHLHHCEREIKSQRKEMYHSQMLVLLHNLGASAIGFTEFGKILKYFSLAIPGLALDSKTYNDFTMPNGQPHEKCLEITQRFLHHNIQQLKAAIADNQRCIERDGSELNELKKRLENDATRLGSIRGVLHRDIKKKEKAKKSKDASQSKDPEHQDKGKGNLVQRTVETVKKTAERVGKVFHKKDKSPPPASSADTPADYESFVDIALLFNTEGATTPPAGSLTSADNLLGNDSPSQMASTLRLQPPATAPSSPAVVQQPRDNTAPSLASPASQTAAAKREQATAKKGGASAGGSANAAGKTAKKQVRLLGIFPVHADTTPVSPAQHSSGTAPGVATPPAQ
jgi:septum formation inhibitor MinC